MSEDPVDHQLVRKPNRIVPVGPLLVDYSDGHVTTPDGRIVQLTNAELKLLTAISPLKFKNPDEILEVYAHMADKNFLDFSQNYVPQIIQQLRTKIEADPKNPAIIINKRGHGYKITDPKSNQNK